MHKYWQRIGIVALVAALCSVAPHRSTAAPEVVVKAQTLLQLGEVRRVDRGRLMVTGTFVDRITGAAIANSQIAISVAGENVTAVTADDGSFRAYLDDPTDSAAASADVGVELTFRGSNALDAAFVSVTTDPTRTPVTVRVYSTPTDKGATLRFETEPEDLGPVQLQLSLVRDGKTKALATTSSNALYALTRAAVGGPGALTIKVEYAGDSLRQKAATELALDFTVTTTTTLALSTSKVAYEDSVVGKGRVIDADEVALENAVVALYAGDRRLDQTTTDSNGAFQVEFEAKLLGQGNFGLTVRTERTSTREGSVSQPAVVSVAAPQPVPVRYTLVAFALTAIAALVFFAMRRRRHTQPKVTSPEPATPPKPPEGSVELARPSIVSGLRKPSDLRVAGVVRDATTRKPISGAVVQLAATDGTRTVQALTDPRGMFDFGDIEAATWKLTFSYNGYLTQKAMANTPHRGEYRSLAVNLASVREHVFHLYRGAAEPLLPDKALWGIWSPRQIVDHVKAKQTHGRNSPALSELTDLVEEVYFSPRIAAETIVPHAESKVDAALRERHGS